MASSYIDKTPAQRLDKKTLNKMVWRSYNLQGSFNFERMQANGWLYSILPGLEKIHTNKEDLSASMQHNLDFFNTHPFLVTFVMGIVLSLEEQKIDINTIRSVRVAAMGPLGGIGDALFWLTLVPITASIGASIAASGEPSGIIGPILFLVIYNAVQFALRKFLMFWSYGLGEKAIDIFTSNAREFTHAASLLGVFIVGVLVANMGSTTVAITIPLGNGLDPIAIQPILDGILPKILPLAITLGCYGLLKKNFKPVTLIIGMIVIGLVGAFIGIF